MNNFRSLFLSIMLLILTMQPAMAAADFQIKDIELIGARRVTLATVISYMPVKVSDVLTSQLRKDALKALYKTGFFKDVRLLQRGDVLIVSVVERPAIASIKLDGNSKVKTDDIMKAFDEAGLSEGQIYNDTVLEQMRSELQRLYYSYGRYGVKLDAKVIPLSRNRVDLDIKIKEGITTKIRQINIVGNTAFEDETLLDEFESGVPHFLAIFSSKDEYSKKNLSGDLEKLNSYYLDRGYANYKLDSTQVTITPDKKDIYITISITEGDLYKFRSAKLAGKTMLLEKLMQGVMDFYVKKDEYFSQQHITKVEEEINSLLGGSGFAFSEVHAVTEIDEKTKEVDVIFNIDPGKRVYVRHISFSGNEKTLDNVYRRELRQMEGAMYTKNRLERSKVRLERLPYVEEVKYETPAVPETDDQVDVVYTIKERLSGSFNVGAGYSDANGASFQTGLSQSNLLGTGNIASFDLQSNRVVKNFNINFTDPFYTQDGVSRSLNAFLRKVDTSKTVLSSYVINSAGLGLAYGIPISEWSRLQFGINVANNKIEAGFGITPEIFEFIEKNGDDHNVLTFNSGYVYDTRNRTLFATAGNRQAVSLELAPGPDLKYYKLGYNGEYYWPVSERTSFLFLYDIGIGNGLGDLDQLPFYEKFIAGGITSMRGFKARSIGPKDGYARPYGGDLKTIGSVEYLFPQPVSQPARFSLFLDIGNVYETMGDFKTDELRASYGVSARWLTPMGALTFSYAQPFKYDKGVSTVNGFPIRVDILERFQFTIGSSF